MPSSEGVLTQILTIIAAVVTAGGGIGVIVYLALRFFAQKWLENRFAQSLEAFRHRQQQELERLRLQINTQLDRVTKLHQHEFEALPQAWALITDSYYGAVAVTSSFQSYPDLDRMAPAELDQFIRECSLEEWQKDELKSVSEKTRYYIQKITWRRLSEARSVSFEARSFVTKHGIFMQREIIKEFERLDDMIFKALIEKQFNEEYPEPPLKRDDQKTLHTNGKVLLNELEARVHARLWSRLPETEKAAI